MSPLQRTVFLTCCFTVVPACMHYSEYPADYYDVDSSSVIFPSIPTSVFNTPNRAHVFADEVDLRKQYAHAVDAIFALTSRLRGLLGQDANKNVLVSPVSSTLAIAELLLGARGPSRQELLNILTTVSRTKDTAETSVAEFHHQLGGLLKLLQTSPDYDDAYQLYLASAIFMNPELKLLPAFHTAITDLYGVSLFPLNFSGDPEGALKVINEWAALHTRGVIDKIYTQPLPRGTAAVLTNAIYFKGDWETPFSPRYTKPGKFKTNETHEVDVQYMRGQFELMYTENERLGCRMIAIPYKHAKAAMYVILPKKEDLYDIQSFAADFSVEDVRELIASTRLASMTLQMPKMTLTHTFSIRDAILRYQKQIQSELKLKEKIQYTLSNSNKETSTQSTNDDSVTSSDCLNCTDCVQSSCNSSAQDNLEPVQTDDIQNVTNNPTIEMEAFSFDLSGASLDPRFRVDDIVHNIFLEVNEVGTVAAAVGATTVDYFGEYRNFKIDRPFVFFIRQEVTGTPLFWGTIVNPKEQ